MELSSSAPPPASTDAFTRAAIAWQARVRERSAAPFGDTLADSAVGAGWQQPPTLPLPPTGDAPALRHRRFSVVTVGATVTALVAVALVDARHPLAWFAYPAAALVVLAAALVVSAWTHRPRLLLPVALAVGLVTSASLVTTSADRMGQQVVYRYSTTSELPAAISSSMGHTVLDLSGLAVTSPCTLTVTGSMGTTTIQLPRDANVRLRWRVDMGRYTGPDASSDGRDATGEYVQQSGAGQPILTLLVTQSMGRVTVVRS